MGFKDATLPWKIFYIAFPTFLLAIIIMGIVVGLSLRPPGASVSHAYIYCPDYNLTQDPSLSCAMSAECNGSNITDCRDPSRGLVLRIVFNVNNPSIASCSIRAEVDVYDDTRAIKDGVGPGTYLLATSYFYPGHLVQNTKHLGKQSRGQYEVEVRLKDSGDVSVLGSQITYANSMHLIASQMRRSCCPSCPVTIPDYSQSCASNFDEGISIRVKGKMHYSCLIEPKVNFDKVVNLNSSVFG